MASKLSRLERLQRNLRVVELKNSGYTFEEIAKQMGFKSSQVVHYCYKQALRLKESDPQRVQTALIEGTRNAPTKLESDNAKLSVNDWPLKIKELIGGIITLCEEKLPMEKGMPFHKVVQSLETLVKLDRLMSGRSTDNIFKLDIKANMDTSEMLKILTDYREKNVTINSEEK